MRTLLFSICASVALAVPAAADTIPLPSIQVNGAPGDFGSYVTPGSTIILSSLPNPSVTATTAGLGPNDTANEYYAQGSISYNVEITGGQYGDSVPLLVAGSLSTSASAPDGGDVSYGQASIGITGFGGIYGDSASAFCGDVIRGADCSHPTWSGILSAIGGVGYNNLIQISAMSVVESSGSAYAFADPYVYIDPTFLAANPGYSLVLNVGNSPTAAPEPSTLMLAATCLFGLIVASRKKVGPERNRAAIIPSLPL